MPVRRTTSALLLSTVLLAAACGGSDGSGGSTKSESTADSKIVVLQDDKHLQTVDNIVPVVRTAVAKPPLTDALNKVSGALTTAKLIELNRDVDIERKDPDEVAKNFVAAESLGGGSGGSGKITVAVANFSENQILGNIYAEVLKSAGYNASVKQLTNREVYEPALEKGQLDVVPEYAGTLTEFLNKKANGPNAPAKASSDTDATVTALRALAEPRGLTVLEPAEAQDVNAFAVTKKFADKHNFKTLSDLAKYDGNLVLGGPSECPTRPFCRPGLEKTYGLKFSGFKSLDAGGPLSKQALKQGKVQVALIFSSDASIETS